MDSDHRCFFCFTRAFEKLLEKETISNEAKNNFTRDMVNLYTKKSESLKSPEFARELHALLRSYTLNADPYKKEKKENNNQVISMLPELRLVIQQSENSFNTALRLAIAGNIMDFAAGDTFDLQSTIKSALLGEFAIDNSEQLKEKIKKAESILYLGDNAGEIVFDKLFIQTINHPNITYVVRGAPVLNDATMDDADYTRMKDVANVISNGYDAPSTILHKSDKQFQEFFRKADLIISKGQGNLEGLFELKDDRIFFLLIVKCNVIGEFLNVKKGSLVVFNS
jgi:damage-control phosphatase, subfamily I